MRRIGILYNKSLMNLVAVIHTPEIMVSSIEAYLRPPDKYATVMRILATNSLGDWRLTLGVKHVEICLVSLVTFLRGGFVMLIHVTADNPAIIQNIEMF